MEPIPDGVPIIEISAVGMQGPPGSPGTGGVPNGGTTGQVLTKLSDFDGDADWETFTDDFLVLPLTTVLNGVPMLVWSDINDLIPTEMPL